MTTDSPEATPFAWRAAMLASFAAVFAYLLHRNLGLNPAIFADEWYYSKMARLLPLSEAMVPSYLYLWMFRATSACGNGFLDCVRIGNALLFIGAAPFIYLVARRVLGQRMAFAVTLMSMLAPVNVYTAYFMPESAYFFGVAVLSWIVLTRTAWGPLRHALTAGTVLGLMSLVKVHALFLLPALAVFLLYLRWTRGGAGWLRGAVLAVALAALALFAVKFGLGYLLAGDPALTLFGSLYSGVTGPPRPLLQLLSPAFINGRGHLMALAVLLSLPLATIAYSLLTPAPRAAAGAPRNLLQLYALLMLGAAVAMTVAFTASIAHLSNLDVLRLHLRYYSFLFPLLFIVAAAAPVDDGAPARPRLRWTIAAALAVVLAVALVKLPLYSLNPIDSPELSSIGLEGWRGRTVVGIDLLLLLLWARGNALARPLFLFLALPLMLASAGRGTSDYLAQLKPSWESDKAGKFAHRYVPKEEHKFITVATTGEQELMRVQFHIDDKDVATLDLPKGAALEPYQIPVYNKWLLVVGQHALPEGIKPVVANADYALVKLEGGGRSIGRALMSEQFGSGIVTGAAGLSGAEPWGRWSVARQVVVHFNIALPKHVMVVLKARAFDVNATLPFTMQVGDGRRRFRLAPQQSAVGLNFDTDGRQRSLTIEVPHPISPAELGQQADPRKLGIGIGSIEIREAKAPSLTAR
jgi:hypothetical protein